MFTVFCNPYAEHGDALKHGAGRPDILAAVKLRAGELQFVEKEEQLGSGPCSNAISRFILSPYLYISLQMFAPGSSADLVLLTVPCVSAMSLFRRESGHFGGGWVR